MRDMSISSIVFCHIMFIQSRKHVVYIAPVQEVQLGDGEAVNAMLPSLDGMMLAVQRSPAFLQFVHVRSSKMFVQVSWYLEIAQPRQMANTILASMCDYTAQLLLSDNPEAASHQGRAVIC